MADLWRKEGQQFFDDNNNVLAGGVLRYFDSGTTNPRTVYKDDGAGTSWGTSVTLDSAGRLTEAIYVVTGDFKETLEDSSASQIFENDEIPGALDLSSYLTSATYERPTTLKTANYTVASGDAGKLITANPTGGTFQIDVGDAATMGDGFAIGIKHIGTANRVKVKTDTSEGYVLTYPGQAIELVSDGAGWNVNTEWGIQLDRILPIQDRNLLTPPGSPDPGDYYLLPSNGTLLGDWASFSNGDIVQSNGQNAWTNTTLGTDDEGLVIDVLDENVLVRWDGSSFKALSAIAPPQGYLTVVQTETTPIVTTDQEGKNAIYYSPFTGNYVPIPDGTVLNAQEFAQLTLSLNSNHVANTIYDVFIWSESGTLTIGTGPAWNNSAAGSGDRGTGSGTTELTRLGGLLVNNFDMTTRNGSTTYSVEASNALYVGSILIDSASGEVTCHITSGQDRRWGVWNAYNRRPIQLLGHDATASWSYSTNSWRNSNNDADNKVTIFAGLPEEMFELEFSQKQSAADDTSMSAGIGVDSNSSPSGVIASWNIDQGSGTMAGFETVQVAKASVNPQIGISEINALEKGSGASAATAYGDDSDMRLVARWMG